jgi:bacterial transferase hexapeptide domain-containing protein
MVINCLVNRGGYLGLTLIAMSGLCSSFTFQFWWRLNAKKGILKIIPKLMFTHYYRKWGLHIPSATRVGPGLVIWHPIGIVINPKVKIGNNCSIFQFVSIGEEKGKNAIIGDNVTIGPNVSIVGGVKIGNNVKIGAGTVVIHDVPDNCTTVGNPNRIIYPKTGS